MHKDDDEKSVFRRPRFYCMIGMFGFVAWLFTGGIADQKVERYDTVQDVDIGRDEQVGIAIRGQSKNFGFPLLLDLYRESAPFHLSFYYNNFGSNPPKSVRIRKVQVSEGSKQIVDLLADGAALTLSIMPHQHFNSSSAGISSYFNHRAEHQFATPLPISFQSGHILKCEMELDLVFPGTARPLQLNWELKGRRHDKTGTGWSHIGDC